MIAYDLKCGAGHSFEGWFGSSQDFDAQVMAGLLVCPLCDDRQVHKTLSVPNIGKKGNQVVAQATLSAEPTERVTGEVINAPSIPPAMTEMMQKVAAAQTELLKDSQWVGRKFAETARAIHYGEETNKLIHGETSAGEARDLIEEGIGVAPLPLPVIPPQAKN